MIHTQFQHPHQTNNGIGQAEHLQGLNTLTQVEKPRQGKQEVSGEGGQLSHKNRILFIPTFQFNVNWEIQTEGLGMTHIALQHTHIDITKNYFGLQFL